MLIVPQKIKYRVQSACQNALYLMGKSAGVLFAYNVFFVKTISCLDHLDVKIVILQTTAPVMELKDTEAKFSCNIFKSKRCFLNMIC